MVGEGSAKTGEGGGNDPWATRLLNPEWLSVLSSVKGVGEKTGVRVLLVGGIVRHAIFSVLRPELVSARQGLLDIDFAVEGDFEVFLSEIQRTLSPKKVSRSAFLTAVCDLPDGLSVDFAQCRSEVYRYPGSLPEVKSASLELDSTRRDFSINAIYLAIDELFRPPPVDLEDLRTRIIDHVGGFQALNEGMVEVLHSRSILDDPTRIFRGVRYRAVLSAFSLDGKFGAQFLGPLRDENFLSDSSPLAAVSHFRKWVELKKCFQSGYPREAIGDLINLGIFELWPPVPLTSRSVFLGRIDKLLVIDTCLLSEYGFLMCAAIWWWTNLDAHLNEPNDSMPGSKSNEQFIQARNELRLTKTIKRAIADRRPEDLDTISWLREAAAIYGSASP